MNNFRGWKTVFSFTFRQHAGTKAYKIVTVVVAMILIAATGFLTVLSEKPEKKDDSANAVCNVEKAYVLDLAGVGEIPYAEWMSQRSDLEYYGDLSIQEVTGMTEQEVQELAAKEVTRNAIGVVYERDADIIFVRALVPSTSHLDLNDGQDVAAMLAELVKQKNLQESGLNEFQISQIEKKVMVTFTEAGGENGVITYLIRFLAPMVFGLFLYFLLLLYGQSISQEVSTEKTSKLMETLLTSLHPYALLTGKVFAIVSTALVQVLIWIASLFIGLAGGVLLAKQLFPGAEGSIGMVIDFLRANIGDSALSPEAVVLSLITFACGFLFYCVLAGIAGSMVTRPEEAASVQSIFTMPIVISWLICYMGVLLERQNLLVIARFIPFTIPFCIPVDLLTGAVSIVQGLISALILLVFSFLCIMVAAKIYKGIVLYNGQKVTLKTIVSIVRGK